MMSRMTRNLLPGAGILLAGLLAAGCAQLQENLEGVQTDLRTSAPERASSEPAATTSAPARQQQQPQEEAAEVTSPVRISLDGNRDAAADPYGIYWEVGSRVSSEPSYVMTLDRGMGDHVRTIINIYEADDEGRERGQPWAITDHGGEQILVPDRSINLANPGPVVILSGGGEQLDSIPLRSGQTYVALFVVQGSESNHTHKVRFTVR